MINELLTTLHLNPNNYPDAYLALVVPIHAGAAILAAVVACPIAIFARKGSRLHRVGGYGVVVLSAILVIGSLFVVVDSGVNQIVANASIFPAGEYNQFYLVTFSFAFGYYVFSAARVWWRLPQDGSARVGANWFDWFLALSGLAVALIYLIGGIYVHDLNNYLSIVYMLTSIFLFVFTLIDIYTFIKRPTKDDFPWWVLHMSKMVLVWMNLVRFIFFRVLDTPVNEFVVHQIVFLVAFVVVSTSIYLYKRRDFRVRAAAA